MFDNIPLLKKCRAFSFGRNKSEHKDEERADAPLDNDQPPSSPASSKSTHSIFPNVRDVLTSRPNGGLTCEQTEYRCYMPTVQAARKPPETTQNRDALKPEPQPRRSRSLQRAGSQRSGRDPTRSTVRAELEAAAARPHRRQTQQRQLLSAKHQSTLALLYPDLGFQASKKRISHEDLENLLIDLGFTKKQRGCRFDFVPNTTDGMVPPHKMEIEYVVYRKKSYSTEIAKEMGKTLTELYDWNPDDFKNW
ncbi:hypothetical protein F5Y18DRAFT_432700 [Xylariaceae sp. FL1019]|nr:hypothetical protein F5Y18DRAFT_432700 [Xylariaceae sp. FL1019]